MATITTRRIIETMLENDGRYPGDPRVSSIWEYRHAVTGNVMWAVFYQESHNDLMENPYVEEYLCLWNRMAGHVNPMGCLERSSAL